MNDDGWVDLNETDYRTLAERQRQDYVSKDDLRQLVEETKSMRVLDTKGTIQSEDMLYREILVQHLRKLEQLLKGT